MGKFSVGAIHTPQKGSILVLTRGAGAARPPGESVSAAPLVTAFARAAVRCTQANSLAITPVKVIRRSFRQKRRRQRRDAAAVVAPAGTVVVTQTGRVGFLLIYQHNSSSVVALHDAYAFRGAEHVFVAADRRHYVWHVVKELAAPNRKRFHGLFVVIPRATALGGRNTQRLTL